MHTCDGPYCPITKAWCVLSYYTVLLVLKSGQLIANHTWEICYSYDYIINWTELEIDAGLIYMRIKQDLLL